MSFTRFLDTLGAYVPGPVKPIVSPAYPLYVRVRSAVFRHLPERVSQSPWGPRLVVDPANFVERRLSHGTFETETIEFFRRDLIDSTVGFADVGANVGFYSILYALESGSASDVNAIEPLPENRERLRRNLALNDTTDIEVHGYALSDTAGAAELSVSDAHVGEASLSSELKSAPRDRQVTVDLRTLDSMADELGRPGLLKIDVEGAECRVIEGGRTFLSERKPGLLLEVHPGLMGNFGDDASTLRELLEASGYSSVYQIETDRHSSVDELDSLDLEEHSNVYIT